MSGLTTIARIVRPHPGWLVPAGLWAALIWLGSAQPASGFRHIGPVSTARLPLGRLAPVVHFTGYAVLSGLLWLGLSWQRRRSRALAAVLAATAYGVVDEWHQSSVSGRDASGFDVATDAAGAVAGVLVAHAINNINDA